MSAPAFDFVSAFYIEEGFKGPTTWREGAYVPYTKDLSETIKARAFVSSFSADNGYAAFDGGVSIFSKTLHDLACANGVKSVMPHVKGTYPGFVPCLSLRLAHMKWCQQPSDVNPSWAMTLENDTARPNARAFAADFKSLLSPVLDGLKSDDDLKALLKQAMPRGKPEWVKSENPWFTGLPDMVELLERNATA